MSTVRLKREDIHRGPLILVNAQHKYVDGDKRPGLTPIGMTRLDKFAACALNRVLSMTEFKNTVVAFDGYRSICMQRALYSNSLRENGEQFTKSYVAVPGASEHHTGLAIDMAKQCEEIDPIRPDFPYTGVCGRFRTAALRHGFIERYGKGKEHVTGIAHEPWHFRYVGSVHAHVMDEYGLALEEYVEFLRDFDYESGDCMEIAFAGRTFRLGFIACAESEARINVPQGARCKISGNNVDGFVACCW